MQPRYPFRRGDRIRVSVRSWSTVDNILFVRVRYNDGTPDRLQIDITHGSGDYSNELFFSEDTFLQDGYVESLTVASTLENREAYIAVFVDNEAEELHYCIFAGLLDVVHTPLGFFEHEDFSHTWVYQANVTNDGSNSGNHDYVVTPGAGNEMEILYGGITNDDTSARTTEVRIRDDDDNILVKLIKVASTGVGETRPFPALGASGADDSVASGSRLIVTGAMNVLARVSAVAISQDSMFTIVCRIKGGIPTVVITSPVDAVEVIDKNQVFL